MWKAAVAGKLFQPPVAAREASRLFQDSTKSRDETLDQSATAAPLHPVALCASTTPTSSYRNVVREFLRGMDQPTSGQPSSLGRGWRADGLGPSAPGSTGEPALCCRTSAQCAQSSGKEFRGRYFSHGLTGLVCKLCNHNAARSPDYHDNHDYHPRSAHLLRRIEGE